MTSTRSLLLGAIADLLQQIVDLALDRADFDRRIDQAGRTNDLLDEHAAGFVQLVRPRRRRHVDQLADALLQLFEVQRAVVERRRQAEAVLDQHFLARSVAVIHAADLRNGLVASSMMISASDGR